MLGTQDSLAHKATEKGHFLKNISSTLRSKSNFLAQHLPRSSQMLHPPREAFRNALHSHCSWPQAEGAASSRLLPEHQHTPCLLCWAGQGDRQQRVELPAVPLPRTGDTLHCVPAEGLIPQQGRAAASVPCQPSEEQTAPERLEGIPTKPKASLWWSFSWEGSHRCESMAFSAALVLSHA